MESVGSRLASHSCCRFVCPESCPAAVPAWSQKSQVGWHYIAQGNRSRTRSPRERGDQLGPGGNSGHLFGENFPAGVTGWQENDWPGGKIFLP
jgi:hypothetical protein